MAILRLLFASIYFLIASILSLPLCMLRPGSAKNIGIFARIMAFIPKYLLGLKLEIEGADFLESNRPCIFISNHQNSFDFLTCVWLGPSKTVSLGKKNLKYLPLFGQLYWLCGNILINRKSKRRSFETIKDIANKIHHQNLSIWIFPEGTRNYGNNLLPFKNGAFKIAQQIQIPIIPVCIGSYNFNFNRIKSGVIRVKLLPPLKIGQDLKLLKEDIHSQMTKTIALLDQKANLPASQL